MDGEACIFDDDGGEAIADSSLPAKTSDVARNGEFVVDKVVSDGSAERSCQHDTNQRVRFLLE